MRCFGPGNRRSSMTYKRSLRRSDPKWRPLLRERSITDPQLKNTRHTNMSLLPARTPAILSRAAVAFLAIIALHVLVIWAFASGFANHGHALPADDPSDQHHSDREAQGPAAAAAAGGSKGAAAGAGDWRRISISRYRSRHRRRRFSHHDPDSGSAAAAPSHRSGSTRSSRPSCPM